VWSYFNFFFLLTHKWNKVTRLPLLTSFLTVRNSEMDLDFIIAFCGSHLHSVHCTCSLSFQVTKIFSFLCLVFVTFHATTADPKGPEQIHISFGPSPNKMYVMWSVSQLGTSNVTYTPLPTTIVLRAIPHCWKFTKGNPSGLQYLCRAELVSDVVWNPNYLREECDGKLWMCVPRCPCFRMSFVEEFHIVVGDINLA